MLHPLRATGHLLVLALGVALLVLAAGGCGYHQDVPTLPAGAQSIALGTIDNRTETGELDVRLHGQLQRRMEQHAHLRLRGAERATLLIQVELTELTVTRVLDPALTAERSFRYSLSGLLTLTDQRNGRRLIGAEPVTVRVTRLYAPNVRETPAIRDEGLDDVVAAFAEQVERRVLRTF